MRHKILIIDIILPYEGFFHKWHRGQVGKDTEMSPHLLSCWGVNNSAVTHSVFILCHLVFHASCWIARDLFPEVLSRTILAEWPFGRIQNYLKISVAQGCLTNQGASYIVCHSAGASRSFWIFFFFLKETHKDYGLAVYLIKRKILYPYSIMGRV